MCSMLKVGWLKHSPLNRLHCSAPRCFPPGRLQPDRNIPCPARGPVMKACHLSFCRLVVINHHCRESSRAGRINSYSKRCKLFCLESNRSLYNRRGFICCAGKICLSPLVMTYLLQANMHRLVLRC